MIEPLRMKFTKRDLVLFGAGILITLAMSVLIGAKKESPLEQCEYKKNSCEQELDECIATMR